MVALNNQDEGDFKQRLAQNAEQIAAFESQLEGAPVLEQMTREQLVLMIRYLEASIEQRDIIQRQLREDLEAWSPAKPSDT